MRRSGYNSLNNSQEVDEEGDIVDGRVDDVEEAKPFSEPFAETKPYKRTLCLVFTLCFGGLLTLVTSTLILLGHLDSELYADRMIPLMILGLLMFIPGAYYMRIVYYTFRGRSGFSYDQIPSCY